MLRRSWLGLNYWALAVEYILYCDFLLRIAWSKWSFCFLCSNRKEHPVPHPLSFYFDRMVKGRNILFLSASELLSHCPSFPLLLCVALESTGVSLCILHAVWEERWWTDRPRVKQPPGAPARAWLAILSSWRLLGWPPAKRPLQRLHASSLGVLGHLCPTVRWSLGEIEDRNDGRRWVECVGDPKFKDRTLIS